MVKVNEIGLLGTEFLAQTDSFVNGLMSDVGPMAQGVEHKRFYTVQHGFAFVANGFQVGDISEVCDAIAENGQWAVHYFDGKDGELVYLERLPRKSFVQFELWHSAGCFHAEAIGHSFTKMFQA